MNETIGDRIRSLRTLKRMSQQELADKLGVSRVTVNSYELNKIDPNRRLKELASFLDTSIEYLVTGDNPPKDIFNLDTGDMVRLSYQDRQVLSKLAALDERGRITVLDLLDRELALLQAYGGGNKPLF